MKRGDIFAMAGAGDFSGKPRPGLVLQTDLFNEFHPSVTVCPLSSHLTGDNIYRIAISAGADSGLRSESEIEIDKLQSIWVRRLGQKIGRAPDVTMAEVDVALRRWLDL